MLPAVVLVGRPNVGKSTLFNQLTRSRDALVADHPGLTRDRRYGFGHRGEHSFIVVDTAGLGGAREGLAEAAVHQTELALEEASAVVLVVDYQEGLTEADREIAERLRRSGFTVTIAVNKSEGVAPEVAEADFHALGFDSPVGIAALHGRGLDTLIERVLAPFVPEPRSPSEPDSGPRLAVVGRPNVGKSTLINRLLGNERFLTSDEPGTTRDSLAVPCERGGRAFSLIDTAGIRRRARVREAIEKFSVVQALQAIEDCDVAIVVLDAREGVTDQDLHLIGLVIERGRAITIGVNKWDGLSNASRRAVERQVERQLEFVAFADVHYISALHGSAIAELVESALRAHDAAASDLPTSALNELLEQAVAANPPPLVRGRSPRLRYAHQGGRRPPLIVIHGGQATRLPAHYQRYLRNFFRDALRLRGTPLRVEFRNTDNPYADKPNQPTPRQRRHRRRLIRHSRH
jgi:GTPase